MTVEVDPEAVVIRFAPWSEEKALERAGDAHVQYLDDHPTAVGTYYLLSVWADVQGDGESFNQTRRRLLQDAAGGPDGINLDNNKYHTSTRAEAVYRAGFVFVKDGHPDEHENHYSVDLGPDLTVDTVTRFLESFPDRHETTPKEGGSDGDS